MKHNIHCRVKRLSFELGWFAGEPFCLFGVTILNIVDGIGLVQIFNVQIARFFLGVNWTIK